MDNLGKFIYMAGSAMLFVVALSTSLYLYITLDNYLDFATSVTNVYKRVEGETIMPNDETRTITWGEVYLTIANMDQMHVREVQVGEDKFKNPNGDEDLIEDNLAKLKKLEKQSNKKIRSYEVVEKNMVSGDVIKYDIY